MRTSALTAVLAVSFACAAPRAGSVAPAAEPSASAHGEALPFIENDAARALAEGRAKGLPVFVDVWAPW